MNRTRLPALAFAVLLASACVPDRVTIGPSGEVASNNAVYRTAPDGSLVLDTRTMDRLAELYPGWTKPGESADRIVQVVWSRDGKHLAAFFADKEKEGELSLLAWPELARIERWSLPPGYILYPAFSPDGRSLSFVLYDEEEERSLLEVVDLSVSGGEIVTLIEDTSAGHAWSPDGKEIAVLAGSRSGIDDYSLGTLLLFDLASKKHRALAGVLFNSFAELEWSAQDGRIYFLSPSLSLPIAPDEVKSAPWAVLSVDPAAKEPRPEIAVPGTMEGLAGTIRGFARAPGEADRFLVVAQEDDVAHAYLYEDGRLARVSSDEKPERPSAMAAPAWIDGSTWIYKAEAGYRRGRVGETPRSLAPALSAEAYRSFREGLAKFVEASAEHVRLSEFLRLAREKPQEMEYFVGSFEAFVASGSGSPEERALAVLGLGLFPDRPATRAALATRLPDGQIADFDRLWSLNEKVRKGEAPPHGLTVRAYAALALDRLIDGKPYPSGVSPVLDLLRLQEIPASTDVGREEKLSERAAEWAKKLEADGR